MSCADPVSFVDLPGRACAPKHFTHVCDLSAFKLLLFALFREEQIGGVCFNNFVVVFLLDRL